MSKPDFPAARIAFRAYYNSLGNVARSFFLDVLQVTFNIKNRINVTFWVAQSGTTRNFLNAKVSPLDMEMRVGFFKGITASGTPVSVEKTVVMRGPTESIGRRLRMYLADDYTRESVTKISFTNNTVTFSYLADSSAFDETDDDASEEFSGIPTSPPPVMPPPSPKP